MTLGEKLKTYRAEHNMTQEELAARLFVTRAAVSKWERDAGYPGIDSLKLIAKLMECTLDELVSDDDVERQKLRDKRAAGRAYVCAVEEGAIVFSRVVAGRLLYARFAP